MRRLPRRLKLKASEDTGRKKNSRKNDRRCIASGAALDGDTPAIRFVRSPEGVVVADFSEKLPGRGAWVTSTRDSLVQAVKRGAFARSFREQVKLAQSPQAFVENVEEGLKKKALNHLGLLKKAGLLTSGYEKVLSGLKKSEFIAYIHASDGAADSFEKLSRLIVSHEVSCRIVEFFSGPELDQALGGMNVVHLGVKRVKAADAFLTEVERLKGFISQA